MSRTLLILVFVLAACSKKDNKPAPTAGSSEPPAAAAGSAGSGSADPGSGGSAGSAAGSADGSAAGSADSGSAAGSGDGSGSSAATGDMPFEKLSKEEKQKFMRTKVVPAMKTAFQGFDAKEFAKFNCKTCHGKGADTKEFKLPNPDLPKLDFAAIKAGKDKKAAEFMTKVVKPEMAKLLGRPEMSESVPDGFGCLACHEMKK